jgi:hypothetical protein
MKTQFITYDEQEITLKQAEELAKVLHQLHLDLYKITTDVYNNTSYANTGHAFKPIIEIRKHLFEAFNQATHESHKINKEIYNA